MRIILKHIPYDILKMKGVKNSTTSMLLPFSFAVLGVLVIFLCDCVGLDMCVCVEGLMKILLFLYSFSQTILDDEKISLSLSFSLKKTEAAKTKLSNTPKTIKKKILSQKFKKKNEICGKSKNFKKKKRWFWEDGKKLRG